MKKINEKVRLNKFIASSGFGSRRASDELISDGKVCVNSKVCSELSTLVGLKDIVEIEGKTIKPSTLTYIRYYKPAGYITTLSDEKNRKTIYDILPEEVQNLKPVGRLDKDSTGDLINELTHPSVKVSKVYHVIAEGKLNQNDIDKMAKGIEIEKGKMAYAQVANAQIDGKDTILTIVLYQGLNRQIRKMLDFLGHPVISLKRTHHASIDLEGLKRGQFKYLKPKQIQELRNYINKLKK